MKSIHTGMEILYEEYTYWYGDTVCTVLFLKIRRKK